MEELFAYRYEQFKTDKSDTATDEGYGRGIDRTDTTSVSASDIGTVQQNSGILFDGWKQHCKKHGFLERAASQGNQSYDGRAESQGFDTVEAQTEMGSGWGDIAIDALYLAADITMIGETDNNDRQKPKIVRERKRGQKKQQNNDSNEIQLKM